MKVIELGGEWLPRRASAEWLPLVMKLQKKGYPAVASHFMMATRQAISLVKREMTKQIVMYNASDFT